VQNTFIAEAAEGKTETQGGLAVAQDDTEALAALRCRQLSAGFARRTLNDEEGEDFLCFWYQKVSFCSRTKDAGGSTEAISPLTLADGVRPGFEWWSAWRGAPWRFWTKATCSRARFRRRIRTWLAMSSERNRSRNPYGVRTRDECSKRSGRSGCTVGHRVFGFAGQPSAACEGNSPTRAGGKRDGLSLSERPLWAGERSDLPKCVRRGPKWGVPAKTPPGVSVQSEKRCVGSVPGAREGLSDVSPIEVRG
jgi:hypothetical protein